MGSSQEKLSLPDSGVSGLNLVFQKKRETSSPFQNSTIKNLMKKKEEKRGKDSITNNKQSSSPGSRDVRKKKYSTSPKRLPRLVDGGAVDLGLSIDKSPRDFND